jgi:uncharacterized membrane protein required for colicin V production
MIAAAAQSASNMMGFNWFDLVAIAVLGFGLFRGKKNGMSRECIPLVQWLVMIPVCGLCYPMLAGLMSRYLSDKFWDPFGAYIALAVVLLIIFKVLKQKFTEKMVTGDHFKGGEYYLGMMAGVVRFACVLLFVLALLNAPVYTPGEIAQQVAQDQKDFGGGSGSQFSGSYFPHFSQIQAAVFKDSFIGSRIKNNLGFLLINTGGKLPGKNTPAANKPQPVIKIGN